MNLWQAFKMSFKSIMAKKGRSFLTMLGIIIGIASVMTIVSVVNGWNEKSMEYYKNQGTNKVEVYAYQWGPNADQNKLFDGLYKYCLTLSEHVSGITPQGYMWGDLRYGNRSSNYMDYSPQMYMASDQFSVCNNFTIAKGRDLSYLDIQNYHQVCVLGARAARNFFDYQNPVGQQMTLDGIPFTVIGVYAEKDPDNEWSQDNMVVFPYTASRSLGQNVDMSQFYIKAKDADSVNTVITLVAGYLGGIINSDTGDYQVYSQNQWMEENNEMANMMSLVLGGIAFISLLVGGIGIMNIMLVTVTERTREIGIRRAIGARRASIVTQFLMESAMICGIGGIFGILLGYAGTVVAGRLIVDMTLYPSPLITLGAFAFSVVLGMIFGMYPAIKASGLQPVVALRAE